MFGIKYNGMIGGLQFLAGFVRVETSCSSRSTSSACRDAAPLHRITRTAFPHLAPSCHRSAMRSRSLPRSSSSSALAEADDPPSQGWLPSMGRGRQRRWKWTLPSPLTIHQYNELAARHEQGWPLDRLRCGPFVGARTNGLRKSGALR